MNRRARIIAAAQRFAEELADILAPAEETDASLAPITPIRRRGPAPPRPLHPPTDLDRQRARRLLREKGVSVPEGDRDR